MILASGGAVMTAFLLATLVAGYVALWALWKFVFAKAPIDEAARGDVDPSLPANAGPPREAGATATRSEEPRA